MRRAAIAIAVATLAGVAALPVAAQDGATGSPPERIDLTITRERPPDPRQEEACRRQREAAIITGEIVVCGAGPREDQRITSREEAQNRYAAETQGRGPVQLPEYGIFRGPATIGGLCVPGILNCPKPPAIFVDVAALPQAPPGSDADRIGRGLAPLGEDESAVVARQTAAQQREELGLPAPVSGAGPDSTPSGSAAPAEPQ